MTFIIYGESKSMPVPYCMPIASNVGGDHHHLGAEIVVYLCACGTKIPTQKVEIVDSSVFAVVVIIDVIVTQKI